MTHEENIEKYVRGELSPEEKNAFEKKLATDEKSVEELAVHRKNMLAIKAAVRQKLRGEVGAAYSAINQKTGRRILFRRVMAVAAGIVMLIAAGIIWMNGSSGKIAPGALYAKHFEMPAAPSVRNGMQQVNPKWQNAVDFFAGGKYKSAIPLLQELLTDESFGQRETAKLLLGTCLLSEGDTNGAIEILDQITPESTYQQDAEWYHALALLKGGNLGEAKQAFEKIAAQERHFKKKESKDILEAW